MNKGLLSKPLWLVALAASWLTVTDAFANPTVTEPAHNDEESNEEPAEVRASWLDGGWKVTRTKKDEDEVTLEMDVGGSTKRITGHLQGKRWSFWVTSDKPADVDQVSLTFHLYRKVDAASDLTDYARVVLRAVYDAFQSVYRLEGSTAEMARRFASEALTRVLDESDELRNMTIDRRPAREVVLERLGFKNVESRWELSDGALAELRRVGEHDALEWQASRIESVPTVDECAKGEAEATVRLHTCLGALKTALDEFAGTANATEAWKATSKVLADKGIFTVPAENLGPKVLDSQAGIGSGFPGVKDEYRKPLEDLRAASSQIAAPPKVVFNRLDAIRFLAAQHFYNINAQKRQDELTEQLLAGAMLEQLEVDERTKDSAEIIVTPGNPRFFFSTGVSSLFLNDSVRFGLPILSSICLGSDGCLPIHKWPPGHNKPENIVTFDMGVNATVYGEKDPRMGPPAIMIGGGLSPFYATHFSVGAALFHNPQTNRGNAALYLSATIDLIDGKDILGGLGLSKPSVQVSDVTDPSSSREEE